MTVQIYARIREALKTYGSAEVPLLIEDIATETGLKADQVSSALANILSRDPLLKRVQVQGAGRVKYRYWYDSASGVEPTPTRISGVSAAVMEYLNRFARAVDVASVAKALKLDEGQVKSAASKLAEAQRLKRSTYAGKHWIRPAACDVPKRHTDTGFAMLRNKRKKADQPDAPVVPPTHSAPTAPPLVDAIPIAPPPMEVNVVSTTCVRVVAGANVLFLAPKDARSLYSQLQELFG